MRMLLLFVVLIGSIRFVENSQCGAHPSLAGHCGCCSIIGGKCIYFDTIDGIDVSWHLCVPPEREKNFSLDECLPHLLIDKKNGTRICRTTNGMFRLFPQCATKRLCRLPLPSKVLGRCKKPVAVRGPCEEKLERFSYDPIRRECIPFIYSGCGGSKNRFLLQKNCLHLCRH